MYLDLRKAAFSLHVGCIHAKSRFLNTCLIDQLQGHFLVAAMNGMFCCQFFLFLLSTQHGVVIIKPIRFAVE